MKRLCVFLLALCAVLLVACTAKTQLTPSAAFPTPSEQQDAAPGDRPQNNKTGGVEVLPIEGAAENMPRAENGGAPSPKLKELPAAQDKDGRDNNVNMDTLDTWLGREDAVYIDLRDPDTVDTAIAGFSFRPFQALCKEAFESRNALYTKTQDGYLPVYTQSEAIIKNWFPEDKALLLAGKEATAAKTMLTALGYDVNKLYILGDPAAYTGRHAIQVTEADGRATYKLEGRSIQFDTLARVG